MDPSIDRLAECCSMLPQPEPKSHAVGSSTIVAAAAAAAAATIDSPPVSSLTWHRVNIDATRPAYHRHHHHHHHHQNITIVITMVTKARQMQPNHFHLDNTARITEPFHDNINHPSHSTPMIVRMTFTTKQTSNHIATEPEHTLHHRLLYHGDTMLSALEYTRHFMTTRNLPAYRYIDNIQPTMTTCFRTSAPLDY
jgi:hypothetical protein